MCPRKNARCSAAIADTRVKTISTTTRRQNSKTAFLPVRFRHGKNRQQRIASHKRIDDDLRKACSTSPEARRSSQIISQRIGVLVSTPKTTPRTIKSATSTSRHESEARRIHLLEKSLYVDDMTGLSLSETQGKRSRLRRRFQKATWRHLPASVKPTIYLLDVAGEVLRLAAFITDSWRSSPEWTRNSYLDGASRTYWHGMHAIADCRRLSTVCASQVVDDRRRPFTLAVIIIIIIIIIIITRLFIVRRLQT